MAVALPLATKEKLSQPARILRRVVKYRRRFWDIETQAFKLEAGFTQLGDVEIAGISDSREAVDRKGINRFEASNITIELHNLRNRWSKQNPDGVFGKDATARLGYEPQLMEFAVESFVELEDGTDSAAIPMFIGRAVAFEFRPADDTVSIIVESRAVLLRRTNAEEVSDPINNEAATATGDPDVFLTANTGVKILAVRLNDVQQRLGVEVKISDEGDPALPGKITFTDTPPVSPDIRVDYIIWKKDMTIEELVGLLADAAGIPTLERDIQSVTYPNFVIRQEEFTTTAQFDTGTKQNIETTSIADEFGQLWFLVDDFSDLDFSANPAWTVLNFGGTISAASGALVLNNTPGDGAGFPLIFLNMTRDTGTWSANINTNSVGAEWYFFAVTNSHDGNGNFNGTAYYLEFRAGVGDVRLRRKDGASQATLLTGTFSTGTHEYRVTRDASGNFELFIDNVSQGTVNDTTYTTNNFMLVGDHSNSTGQNITIDDIFYSPALDGTTAVSTATPIWTSPVIDGSTGLKEWQGVVTNANMPVGTIVLVETATSDDGLSFDPFVAVGPAPVFKVNSVQRRFIKIRVTLASLGHPTFTSPKVLDINLNFISITLEIALANFSGLSALDALTELGKIANFEWGFLRDGTFFFRPRTASTVPVLTITLPNVKSFSRISDGIERLKTFVRGRYGTHEKTADPAAQGDASPNAFDIHGYKPLDIGSTQLLLDPDADIATGLTKSYLEEFKLPRRVFEVEIDFRPELELTDPVLLRVVDAVGIPWHIGDTMRAIGDKDIHLYGEPQQSAYEVLGRALTVRHDTASSEPKTSLELEEIL